LAPEDCRTLQRHRLQRLSSCWYIYWLISYGCKLFEWILMEHMSLSCLAGIYDAHYTLGLFFRTSCFSIARRKECCWSLGYIVSCYFLNCYDEFFLLFIFMLCYFYRLHKCHPKCGNLPSGYEIVKYVLFSSWYYMCLVAWYWLILA